MMIVYKKMMRMSLLKWTFVCCECAAEKAKAEAEYANARTQQEAERAERAMHDSANALKEIMKLKVRPLTVTHQNTPKQGNGINFFPYPILFALSIMAELKEIFDALNPAPGSSRVIMAGQ